MVMLGGGQPGDRNYLPLATRNGTIIKNEVRFEAPPARMAAAIKFWQVERPEARVRSATSTYDCMGMIFASRRTTVAIDQLQLILSEDGYRAVVPPELPQVDDVVVYSRGGQRTHVATIIQINRVGVTTVITVLSKWGADPEYVHPIGHVPEMYGAPSAYWTDRRSAP